MSPIGGPAPGRDAPPGRTVFFRNLAESVNSSTRNLKIGLAFLTVAFVVIVSCLAFVVLKAIQSQEATRTSLEVKMKGAGADTEKQIKAILEVVRTLERRQAELEEKLESARIASEKDVESARAEARAARQELEAVRKTAGELRSWIDTFGKTYAHDRDLIVERIGGLSAQKK